MSNKINASLARDLSPEAIALANESVQAEEDAENSKRIRIWERRMNRTFKGILTRKERVRNLQRGLKIIEAQIAEKEAQ